MLLSIIIPTKDRYHYLRECITTILAVDSDDFELVIQDNTPNNVEILPFIQEIKDDRLKYYYDSKHASEVENVNRAIIHSNGRYVCFIGDDDSITTSLVDAVRYVDKRGIDCLSFYVSGYNWPDKEFSSKAKKDANLFFNKDADGSIIPMNPMKQLKQALKDTICGVPYKVPRMYHAVVARTCLNKIYEITHTYIPGPSPDMAGAVSISLVAGKAIFIKAHLIVSGFCYKSARGEGKRLEHQGNIQDKPWLPENQIELWDTELPKYFSGETILAQSAYEAFCAMKKPQYIKWIQYGNVYARLYKHHKAIRKQLVKFMLKKPSRLFLFLGSVINKMFLRIKKVIGKQVGLDEYNDKFTLTEACKITNERNSKINIEIYN